MLEGLDFEDREIALQVLAAASEQMTERQRQCLVLCVAGYTQAEVGAALGVSQTAVHNHFSAAVRKARTIAHQLMESLG